MDRFKEAAPFGTLLSALSLVVAVLFVAGFSYRWAYYYNFGLNHLLFDFSVQSVVISSIELLRRPSNAALTAGLLFCALFTVNVLVWGVTTLARVEPTKHWVSLATHLIGLNHRFVVEAIRALALIYAAFLAGQVTGYRTFASHVTDQPGNALPAVTIALPAGSKNVVAAVLCDRIAYEAPVFVGSANTLRRIDEEIIGCSGKNQTWRLLYRDQNYIYLFASVARKGLESVPKPLTLAVPARDDLMIIME